MTLKNLFFLKNTIQKHKSDKNIKEYSIIFLVVSIIATLLPSKSNKYGKDDKNPTTYNNQPIIMQISTLFFENIF